MDTARHLRQRAASLRDLARGLDTAPILSLDGAAGDDTWTGPVAVAFVDALWRYQHAVLQAVDDLRWLAWQLDELADRRDAEVIGRAGLVAS